MNESFMWLIIVVVVAVSAPVIGFMIRKWDFHRQVSGKKTMRSFKKDAVEYGSAGHDFNLEAEAAESVTRMRSQVNVLGTK